MRFGCGLLAGMGAGTILLLVVAVLVVVAIVAYLAQGVTINVGL